MTPPVGKLHDNASGEVFALPEPSVIGRSRESAVPVPDPRVSRCRAMIRRQDDGFRFFDLGSVNGSLINGRRVTTSQLLVSGDMIQIADPCFRFEGASDRNPVQGGTSIAQHTIADVRSRKVILFVSDIQGFTAISEKLTPDQLAPIIGFRLEALTRTLGPRVLVSADLLAGWNEGLSCCRSLGAHPVKGRDQMVEVYSLERDPQNPDD